MTVALVEPDFISRDAAAITAEMIATYEAATGRVLQPAQVERVLIDLFAYREALIRVAIQDAALQNLVAFARYPMLDYLGELVGAARLEAAAATTTLQFTLTGVQGSDLTVPGGTRVQSADGQVSFATDEDLVIPAASLTGSVNATATAAGVIGNGFAIGDVSAILDPVPLVGSATNLTATAGGTEVESDDSYRERVRQAPSQFSVAGPSEAYRFHTLSVSPLIIDVAISSTVQGIVRVAVLTSEGLPDAGLLGEVAAALSAETIRPLTDQVTVVAPVEVPYTIDATVRLFVDADSVSVLAAVAAAAEAYAEDRRGGLGRDVVPSQIVSALSVPGVYQVTLTAPAALLDVDAEEWANCTAITITEGVAADG